MLGSQRAELQLCRCAAQVRGYLSQVSGGGGTHSGGGYDSSRAAEAKKGNKRPAEASGMRGARGIWPGKGWVTDADTLSPTKGSKQTKEAVPGFA